MGIVGGALERSVLARRRNFTIAARGTSYARPRAEVTATNACAFVGGSALGIRDTHGVAAIANVRTQLPPSSGRLLGCSLYNASSFTLKSSTGLETPQIRNESSDGCISST